MKIEKIKVLPFGCEFRLNAWFNSRIALGDNEIRLRFLDESNSDSLLLSGVMAGCWLWVFKLKTCFKFL